MKVVVDSKIPFIKGVLERVGVEVDYVAPAEIDAAAVRAADALIVRTRTRCDAALLDGSNVKFIATATIGMDHLDTEYLDRRGIVYTNAPGCNAPAVAQYVWSAINYCLPRRQLTVGVVGVGHVGSIVARWGQSMGHEMLLCDPLRAEIEGDEGFVTIEQIAAEADVITLHTPLTHAGRYPTYHLVDASLLSQFKRKPLLINSSRGEVIDTPAVVDGLDAGLLSAAAVDTWEGEPDVNRALLDRAVITTPHIAGYSLEGKKRATTMALDALTAHFGLPHVAIDGDAPIDVLEIVTPAMLGYNPLADTVMLKSNPDAFESLRNNYNLRHEPA